MELPPVNSEDVSLKQLPRGAKSAQRLFDFFRVQPRRYYQDWGYVEPSMTTVNQLLGGGPLYGIFLHDDQLVGVIGILYKGKYFMRKYAGQYWIHYFVDYTHKGRGIASIAIAQFLEHLRDETPLTRIYAGIYSTNPASIHLMEKLGFEELDQRAATHVFQYRIARD